MNPQSKKLAKAQNEQPAKFTFEDKKGDSDVLIARTIRDGKVYEISVVAIPEQNFEQYAVTDPSHDHTVML